MILSIESKGRLEANQADHVERLSSYHGNDQVDFCSRRRVILRNVNLCRWLRRYQKRDGETFGTF